MFKSKFYRNARAGDLLDAFLVSAISSVLLVRFYLYLTGYPQIGNGSLHIAHMLYGGLFMMASIVIMLSFLGVRARQVSAILGGVGFGIFIDELGKFITRDNNYFYQPTIGLIYAVFVMLYLSFNFLSRKQGLTSREYQINALVEVEEAIANDLDKTERSRIYALLEASDPRSQITKHLRAFADTLEVTVKTHPGPIQRIINRTDKLYRQFWRQRRSSLLIRILFISQVVIIIISILYTIYNNVDDVTNLFDGVPTYGEELLIGQIIFSFIAAGFFLFGLSVLASSKIRAFEQFRRAALLNIYLIQVLVFIRLQFDALPGLAVNIILLLLITFVLEQETKLGKGNKYAPSK